MKNKQSFNFTYSAKEQEEIKKIREKYNPPAETEDKMTQLRRLDAKVNSKASTPAIVIGVIGTLIMGFGMSLIMTDLGNDTLTDMIIGIAVGVVGLLLVCLAYPVYNRKLKKEREKAAPEIMRLTDELIK